MNTALDLTPGVRWLYVDDGAVMFIPATIRFLDLDERGAFLLSLLEEEHWDTDDVGKALTSLLDMSTQVADETVRAFIGVLLRHGALTR